MNDELNNLVGDSFEREFCGCKSVRVMNIVESIAFLTSQMYRISPFILSKCLFFAASASTITYTTVHAIKLLSF